MIGLGTQLDSARFRSLIAEALKLPPTQVTATILGEHGDSMVPIWSAAQAAGLPLEKFPGWTAAHGRRPLRPDQGERRRGHQAQGGARVRRRPLDPRGRSTPSRSTRSGSCPVSSLVSGTYGIRDVCLSVPTVVGRKGVEAQLEIDLWPKEVSALQHSGQVLRETIDLVLKKNPAAPRKAPAQPPAADRRPVGPNGRSA